MEFQIECFIHPDTAILSRSSEEKEKSETPSPKTKPNEKKTTEMPKVQDGTNRKSPKSDSQGRKRAAKAVSEPTVSNEEEKKETRRKATKTTTPTPRMNERQAVLTWCNKAYQNNYSKIVANMIKLEGRADVKAEQELQWAKLCGSFKMAMEKHDNIANMMSSTHAEPETFYISLLRPRIEKVFMSFAKAFDSHEAFKDYNPHSKGIVLYITQKDFVEADILPKSIDSCLAFEEAKGFGLLPRNISTYMEDDMHVDRRMKLCCFGLFHSFIYRYNLVTAIYKSEDGKSWCNSMVTFNRLIPKGENVIITN